MKKKTDKKPVLSERIKETSVFLRGTIAEQLSDAGNDFIKGGDEQLLKFHGVYQQEDRDQKKQLKQEKKPAEHTFMLRLRLPGGICSPQQWLAVHNLSEYYNLGQFKLTTRQTFQLQGLIKSELKPTIQKLNKYLLDTIATCGDISRNVMCSPNIHQSKIHTEAYQLGRLISKRLEPKSGAYHEIWIDGEKTVGILEEPVYGPTFLPRKFKISIAVPPINDVDIYAHCLGFIAIVEGEKIVGYNVVVGGGMGMTHKRPGTYPRLGNSIGFCLPEQAVDISEQVVRLQRDWGDRTDRRHARLKYTVEDMGLEGFVVDLEKRLGFSLSPERPFHFTKRSDTYGWYTGDDGKHHLTLFVMGGRLKKKGISSLMEALKDIASWHTGFFVLTPNQNVIISGLDDVGKERTQKILEKHQAHPDDLISRMRLNALACTALPSCGMALAEGERYMPNLIDELEPTLEENGLTKNDIVIRITGCPNGCARPYVAEIALIGRGPGKYNLYLGGSYEGDRLNRLYKESLVHGEIVAELQPIFKHYAEERIRSGESFGDFVIRAGYVSVVDENNHFHAGVS